MNNEPQKLKHHIEVRPYNMKELCNLYNLSYKVMSGTLQSFNDLLGKRRGYYFSVKQVEIIFEELGVPYTMVDDR